MTKTDKKSIDTLVEDIYEIFTDKHPKVICEDSLKEMSENIAKVVKEQIEGKESNKYFRLRPSNIGTPARQLYFQSKDPEFNNHPPKQEIRFLLGHLLEQLMVFLVEEAGHETSDKQKVVEKHGLRGSLDLRINGQLTDIKSASTYGFKKFAKDQVVEEDTWGYPSQMKFYSDEEKDKTVYWLAIDKQHGDIALASANRLTLPSIKKRIEYLREVLELESPDSIEFCAELPEPQDNGNQEIPKICSWCKYKNKCYDDLRVFAYSNGLRFFTKIEKEPRVQEVFFND